MTDNEEILREAAREAVENSLNRAFRKGTCVNVNKLEVPDMSSVELYQLSPENTAEIMARLRGIEIRQAFCLALTSAMFFIGLYHYFAKTHKGRKV